VASLFESFSHADNSISRKYGGSGLCLSIAKNLVELMGGHISLDSTVDVGSTFQVDLPLKLTSKQELTPPDLDQAVTGNKNTSPPCVLVVEDNRVNQILTKAMLDKLGCHTIMAATGQEALQKLEHETIELVLMDIQMPLMSGLETTKKIRQSQKPYADIPIIAVTGHRPREHEENYQEVGMTAVLEKPISLIDLKKVIHKIQVNQPQNEGSISAPVSA